MKLTRTARACLATGIVTTGAAVAAGPSLATAAGEAFKDVVVRNGDAQPIPTKAIGTTKVDATGQTLTVDATGSKVDASGSTVKVQGDPAAAPIPVEVTNQASSGAAAEPLSKTVHLQTFQTAGAKFLIADLDVPADENWRIDHVGVHQPDFRNGTAAAVDSVFVDALGSEGFAALAGTDRGGFGQDVKMFAPAGSQLNVAAAWREDDDPKGLVVVSLTGERTKASPAAATKEEAPSKAAVLQELTGRK
jgi:hypothetical protein